MGEMLLDKQLEQVVDKPGDKTDNYGYEQPQPAAFHAA